MSSSANGCSRTSFSRTAPSSDAKQGVWFAAFNFDHTFSPIIKPATIHTVLHLTASRNWHVHQLDVKNAFLHERVYCLQPVGFIDEQHRQHGCLLSKSLYRLKQAPRAWFQRFGAHLQLVGFRATQSDSSLFVYKHGGDMAYLLL
jgi:hypothetical protein